jgi:hypothetical protein
MVHRALKYEDTGLQIEKVIELKRTKSSSRVYLYIIGINRIRYDKYCNYLMY